MNTNTAIYVGSDVFKATLDVAVRPLDQHMTVDNSVEGIASMIGRIKDLKPELVVMDATGGYQMLAASLMSLFIDTDEHFLQQACYKQYL